jgi:hypothetical protein
MPAKAKNRNETQVHHPAVADSVGHDRDHDWCGTWNLFPIGE